MSSRPQEDKAFTGCGSATRMVTVVVVHTEPAHSWDWKESVPTYPAVEV